LADVSQDRDGAPAVGSAEIAAGVTPGHPRGWLNSTEDAHEENHVRALDLNLFAGTCAVGLILATPIAANSQPSQPSLGLVQSGAAAVEEVGHRRYRYAHRRYDRPYYRPYHHPYYSYDDWPYRYRPRYYDPGWSRGFNPTEQLLQCLLSQPFVSCG
jgi:hypothetical protein